MKRLLTLTDEQRGKLPSATNTKRTRDCAHDCTVCEPVCAALGIRVVKVRQLKAIPPAREEFTRYMQTGMPPGL